MSDHISCRTSDRQVAFPFPPLLFLSPLFWGSIFPSFCWHRPLFCCCFIVGGPSNAVWLVESPVAIRRSEATCGSAPSGQWGLPPTLALPALYRNQAQYSRRPSSLCSYGLHSGRLSAVVSVANKAISLFCLLLAIDCTSLPFGGGVVVVEFRPFAGWALLVISLYRYLKREVALDGVRHEYLQREDQRV